MGLIHGRDSELSRWQTQYIVMVFGSRICVGVQGQIHPPCVDVRVWTSVSESEWRGLSDEYAMKMFEGYVCGLRTTKK